MQELEPARRSEFLRTLSGILERARENGVAVVYVRHQDDGPLRAGTDAWQIAKEVAPAPEDPIVEKRYCDAFRDTDLAAVLERLGARSIVVCGMQTEYCIDATIREGERRGYDVTLVSDGHATYPADDLTEEQIRRHVHRVARERIAIVPAADLFGTLSRT